MYAHTGAIREECVPNGVVPRLLLKLLAPKVSSSLAMATLLYPTAQCRRLHMSTGQHSIKDSSMRVVRVIVVFGIIHIYVERGGNCFPVAHEKDTTEVLALTRIKRLVRRT